MEILYAEVVPVGCRKRLLVAFVAFLKVPATISGLAISLRVISRMERNRDLASGVTALRETKTGRFHSRENYYHPS